MLRVFLCPVLEKPLAPALGAAEDGPSVAGAGFYANSALAARKDAFFLVGTPFGRALPVFPLAADGTELRPLVAQVRHLDEAAAFGAAEGPDDGPSPLSFAVPIDAAAVGQAPARRAAVDVGPPHGREDLPADGTADLHRHRGPPHGAAGLSCPRHAPGQRARKKDSIVRCCLKNTRYITGYTYSRIMVEKVTVYAQSGDTC